MDDFIQVKHAKKIFKRKKKECIKAVYDVSFDILKGESVGLVGESGCGKSTLAKCILNLIPLTEGMVSFKGENISSCGYQKMRCIRKFMQCIFQNNLDSFNPYYTVRQILREPVKNYGLKEKDKDIYMEELLQKVGLDGSYLNRYPGELSGGQCQRIGIARALVLEPEFVVCDEAVSNLDYSVRNKILHLFLKLKETQDLTYLFISHDLSAVRSICDRVIVMYKGEVMEIISDFTEEKVRHPYTKALMAAALSMEPAERGKNRVLLKKEEDLYTIDGGCVLQNRCLYATKFCREKTPHLRSMGGKDFAACHLI